MKVIEVTKVTRKASPDDLWALWADLSRRTEWDSDLDSITSDEPFGLGQKGIVILKGQPPRRFEVIECMKNEAYTDRFFLPAGGKMDWHHPLKQTPEGIEVKWDIRVHGPTAFILVPIMRSILNKVLPDVVEKFIELAEEKTKGISK